MSTFLIVVAVAVIAVILAHACEWWRAYGRCHWDPTPEAMSRRDWQRVSTPAAPGRPSDRARVS